MIGMTCSVILVFMANVPGVLYAIWIAYNIRKGTVVGDVYLVKLNRSQGFARRGLAALKYIFI